MGLGSQRPFVSGSGFEKPLGGRPVTCDIVDLVHSTAHGILGRGLRDGCTPSAQWRLHWTSESSSLSPIKGSLVSQATPCASFI